MVMDPVRLPHTPKSARMINSGCNKTPQEQSAHDQKYNPVRLLKRQKSERLISTPMYHEMPTKAAIVIDMGRSSLILTDSPILLDWTRAGDRLASQVNYMK